MEAQDRSETIEFINKFEKFPTREDIKSALDNLNRSLDERFNRIHEKVDAAEKHRDKELANMADALRERMQAIYRQLESRVECLQSEMKVTNDASEKAISKADAANEKRFESVNEFRAQMADQSALFISRREVEALSQSNSDKISTLTDRMNRETGRSTGIGQLAGWIFGGVGLIVGLIAIFAWLSNMQPQLERNSDFRRQAEPIIQQKATP